MIDRPSLDSGSNVFWPSCSEKDRDIVDQLNFISFWRRMAILSDGRVAVLPAAAKAGDRVAAFHGGCCLYLVRPLPDQEDTFNFIGECYVDGLMDGAFMDAYGLTDKSAKMIKLV